MPPSAPDFDDFCMEIEGIIGRYPGQVKSEKDPDAEILKIFGEGASAIRRARHGLSDVEELAHTAAEHHPYWRMLNAVTEAARIVLDRWDDTISGEDLDRLAWAVSGMSDALDRLESRDK